MRLRLRMDVQTWHVSDDVQRAGADAPATPALDGCLLKRYGDDRAGRRDRPDEGDVEKRLLHPAAGAIDQTTEYAAKPALVCPWIITTAINANAMILAAIIKNCVHPNPLMRRPFERQFYASLCSRHAIACAQLRVDNRFSAPRPFASVQIRKDRKTPQGVDSTMLIRSCHRTRTGSTRQGLRSLRDIYLANHA